MALSLNIIGALATGEIHWGKILSLVMLGKHQIYLTTAYIQEKVLLLLLLQRVYILPKNPPIPIN